MRDPIHMAEEIVGREGGFVNDPDDPGGATNYGVTIHTMRRLGLDLDGSGAIDVHDVRALTKAQAIEIFLDHYYRRPRIDELPEALRASVFDMFVNAGGNAVKILQHLLCDMGEAVAIDGVLGPQSIGAAVRAAAAAPDHIADAYAIARRNYYFAIADRRPQSRKFARRRDGGKGGWIVRAEEFMSPRYRMTRDQFDERVAKWG